MGPTPAPRQHGGPDARGPVRWDFSTNSNACGPCPWALEAIAQADPSRYPDPSYTGLRHALATWHGVAPERLLFAASASEAIQRLTAWSAQAGARQVAVPSPAYGDYAHAARAWGLVVVQHDQVAAQAALTWHCDPASPTGQGTPPPQGAATGVVVLDRAYDALRLDGSSAWTGATLDHVWQLWSPNKALGLTGVRGAYLIAPLGAEDARASLEALAPSWPLGAHAVAMLGAWAQAGTHHWLAECRATLRTWRTQLQAGLRALGWAVLPSQTPYACYRPPVPLDLERLRGQGIQLRDTTSMGLPGHYRLNTLPPPAQLALFQAVRSQTGPVEAPVLHSVCTPT